MSAALHRGGHAMRVARARLVGLPCWRCGEPIDPRLSGLHPDGLTVGHRIPVARGGTDAPDNLAAEHRRCNLAAAARIAPPRATIVRPVFSADEGATLPPPSRRTVPGSGGL